MATRRLLASLLAGAIVLGGCGLGGEKTFTAGQFVDEANGNGAGLELGAELASGASGKMVYGVTLAPKPGDPVLPGTVEVENEGSLSVYEDSGGAEKGIDECEAAADLLCYQAGNIVVVLEAGSPSIAQTRLASAIKKMAK